jgi:hypothetical protein
LIRQRVNDLTVRYTFAATLNDHTFQLGLQSHKSADAARHILQVSLRDPGHRLTRLLRVAGKFQEFTNRSQREAELTAVANEG